MVSLRYFAVSLTYLLTTVSISVLRSKRSSNAFYFVSSFETKHCKTNQFIPSRSFHRVSGTTLWYARRTNIEWINKIRCGWMYHTTFDSQKTKVTSQVLFQPQQAPRQQRMEYKRRRSGLSSFILLSSPSSESESTKSKKPADEPLLLSSLQRTANHLKRLKELELHEQPSQLLDVVTVGNKDEQKQIFLKTTFQKYLLESADSLKRQLKQRRLDNNRGRKPDLAMRLAQDDFDRLYNTEGNLISNSDVGNDVSPMSLSTEYFDQSTTNDVNLIISNEDSYIGEDNFIASKSSRQYLFDSSKKQKLVTNFAGLDNLSSAAFEILSRSNFIHQPTPIQRVAIPQLASSASGILHAETGSGKTLAYLIPITERLWQQSSLPSNSLPPLALIMTPTRELALQVAKIAMVLAPPGTVRYVARPCNLMRMKSNTIEEDYHDNHISPRLWVGSARTIHESLYGNDQFPAPPTTKPEAMEFLKRTRYVVLDEIDRLLLGSTGGGATTKDMSKGGGASAIKKKRSGSGGGKVHEKPAAIVLSAIVRMSWGKVQVVGASATVGRKLTREMARVLGLPPKECPPVWHGTSISSSFENASGMQDISRTQFTLSNISTTERLQAQQKKPLQTASSSSSRAVTIPPTVLNYVVPVPFGNSKNKNNSGGTTFVENGDSKTTGAVASPGMIVTKAYQVIKALYENSSNQQQKPLKMLLVLTRNFGISTTNVIGALRHFQCQPSPQLLHDALEEESYNKNTEQRSSISTTKLGSKSSDKEQVNQIPSSLINKNDSSSWSSSSNGGYLLVTGEDSVRGLDLEGLDVVIIAGRPHGVDEYVHIAGRTGRAGRPGIAITIVPEYEYNNNTTKIIGKNTNSHGDDDDDISVSLSSAPVTFISSWEKMLQTKFIRIVNPSDILITHHNE